LFASLLSLGLGIGATAAVFLLKTYTDDAAKYTINVGVLLQDATSSAEAAWGIDYAANKLSSEIANANSIFKIVITKSYHNGDPQTVHFKEDLKNSISSYRH
jgi:hypothetical protein